LVQVLRVQPAQLRQPLKKILLALVLVPVQIRARMLLVPISVVKPLSLALLLLILVAAAPHLLLAFLTQHRAQFTSALAQLRLAQLRLAQLRLAQFPRALLQVAHFHQVHI
jgi:hypothetical protein